MVTADTTARRQLRRLVVCLDDDPQVLSSLRRLLREEPVDVLTTDQPETVLDWVDRKKVDLLITDLRMPSMDGAEILKVVEERSPRTKSLILTGYPESAPRKKPLIAKPWNDAELKKAIRELTRPERSSRPLPYVVLLPPESRVRLKLVGSRLPVEDLAPGWFEVVADDTAELALLDMQGAGIEDARRLPGAYKVLIMDEEAGGRLREWYEAGVDQVVRRPVSEAVVADLLRRCVPLARLKQQLVREESERASSSWPKRMLRRIWKLGAAIPARVTVSMLATALILGILFAISLNAISAFLASGVGVGGTDAFTDRFLRFTAQEMMLRRWTAMQQMELGREMNEQTRRYYEEQLRNQRWEGLRPRREAAEPSPPKTVVVPVEIPAPAPAPQRSPGSYGPGGYPGNGLPNP